MTTSPDTKPTFIPPEPALARTRRGVVDGRWRWWYASICDYRLDHPGCKNEDIAAHLGKHPNTICAITQTDLYQEYEAQRKESRRRASEDAMRQKLTGVTLKALDALDAALEKKKDQIPLQVAREVVETGLDRLGFAPQSSPTVIVNNSQSVVIPNAVTPAALEEARAAMRAVEARKMLDNLNLPPPTVVVEEVEGPDPRAGDLEPPEALDDGVDSSIDVPPSLSGADE